MGELRVLLKHTETYGGDEQNTTVLGVYSTDEALDARLARIAKANSQYPMRPHGQAGWLIGPEEPEGFFGDREVYLEVQRVKLD